LPANILSVSKYVDRNSGFLHSATRSLRGACMSVRFIDQTGFRHQLLARLV